MAVPSQATALHLSGNLGFFAGGVAVEFLTGAFVKSISDSGLVTVQNANGVEETGQLALSGGATVTVTVSAPTDTDGANGDVHFQVLAGVVLAIWFKIAGAWHEFPLPQVGDGTVLNGNGPPAGNSGKNGDTYRDDATGSWYKKASDAWSAVLYAPSPSGISVAADFPVVADAVAGVWYGDGTPTPGAVGYLRHIGNTHESALRAAYLGNHFFGFADGARPYGTVSYRAGGDLSPRPEGLLAAMFHVGSTVENSLFIDVDSTAGPFMNELTSVTLTVVLEDGTSTDYVLDTVSEPDTGVRRFYRAVQIPFTENLWGAGSRRLFSFTLSGAADPLNIHDGSAVSKMIDEFNLQDERAQIHQEIAPLEEEIEGFRNQYLGANLHGNLFDIDNPLDLNHQEIISDDLVTIKYSHGTLAENQALNNRYVGHRITVGNEELYLTQYQQYLNPEVHISYKAVVMELDADGRVTTVTSSLTRLASRDNSQEYAFNFIDLGITLQADTDYSIGIMQYGGFDQLNLGVLEYTTANSQDPVVAPDIAQNADDIVLGRIDRVTSGSTSWRPDDAIGHLLTAGPANHRQGKPYFIFHKNLSALFINPPNLALQNAGFQVETVDINNKVKVIDFSAGFVVPDSATEKVQVSLVHASQALPGVTRYADATEALAGTAAAHAISPVTLQAVLDDQGVAATAFVGLSDTPAALGTAGQVICSQHCRRRDGLSLR